MGRGKRKKIEYIGPKWPRILCDERNTQQMEAFKKYASELFSMTDPKEKQRLIAELGGANIVGSLLSSDRIDPTVLSVLWKQTSNPVFLFTDKEKEIISNQELTDDQLTFLVETEDWPSLEEYETSEMEDTFVEVPVDVLGEPLVEEDSFIEEPFEDANVLVEEIGEPVFIEEQDGVKDAEKVIEEDNSSVVVETVVVDTTVAEKEPAPQPKKKRRKRSKKISTLALNALGAEKIEEIYQAIDTWIEEFRTYTSAAISIGVDASVPSSYVKRAAFPSPMILVKLWEYTKNPVFLFTKQQKEIYINKRGAVRVPQDDVWPTLEQYEALQVAEVSEIVGTESSEKESSEIQTDEPQDEKVSSVSTKDCSPVIEAGQEDKAEEIKDNLQIPDSSDQSEILLKASLMGLLSSMASLLAIRPGLLQDPQIVALLQPFVPDPKVIEKIVKVPVEKTNFAKPSKKKRAKDVDIDIQELRKDLFDCVDKIGKLSDLDLNSIERKAAQSALVKPAMVLFRNMNALRLDVPGAFQDMFDDIDTLVGELDEH